MGKLKHKKIITSIQYVYDIEVKDNHNYFANNILVHNCKSATSSQGKNLLKLSKVGSYHYALTGTLLVNSPLDAYTPLKFIGRESTTLTDFKNTYCIYEQKYFPNVQRACNVLVGYKNIDNLKSQILNCSLRRTKELLDLPPKTIINDYVEMSEEHRKFYKDIENEIVSEADRVNISTKSKLALVVRLRQAATCPSILTTKIKTETKLDRVCELVEEITSFGDKVIIFSSFKDPLYKLCDMLKEYHPFLGTGDFKDEVTSHNIDIFQNSDEHKVFLGTLSKMSTGITLTSASYMILLDAPWTPSEFTQATDRIHRIGSRKPVTIYNLIAPETIDERVEEILSLKSGISDFIVDDILPDEQVRYLLGLK